MVHHPKIIFLLTKWRYCISTGSTNDTTNGMRYSQSDVISLAGLVEEMKDKETTKDLYKEGLPDSEVNIHER